MKKLCTYWLLFLGYSFYLAFIGMLLWFVWDNPFFGIIIFFVGFTFYAMENHE